MMTLHKVLWSSPCCWMAFWRELIILAWIPEFWYVLTASSRACLEFMLLCKRKYVHSKMRIHPIENYSERLMEGRSVLHQLHEWLTSAYQNWIQDTFEAMNIYVLKAQYHANVWPWAKCEWNKNVSPAEMKMIKLRRIWRLTPYQVLKICVWEKQISHRWVWLMTYCLQNEDNNEVRSGEGWIEEIYQHPGGILMNSINITTGECQTYLLQKDVNMRVENF